MSRAHFFGVLVRSLAGVPSVATAHSRHIQLHWMFNDRVIAVSEATRRYHHRYNLVLSSRIAVVHNFIDTARFTAIAPAARAAARAALGVGGSEVLIGVVGDVIPAKGILDVVASFAAVAPRFPDARLLIVGDGPSDYVARVREAAVANGVAGRLVLTGHRDDVPELLAALDLFVSASLEENFSLALLEAMAAGLPVVATAVGGAPECVSAGETGLLVPPASPAAIAAAIATLASDAQLRLRFGAAGRRRVQERFSADTQVPRIEAVLADAVARRRQAVNHNVPSLPS